MYYDYLLVKTYEIKKNNIYYIILIINTVILFIEYNDNKNKDLTL